MKNIEKKIFTFGLCLCLALANVITALAGGALEQIDISGNVPSPIPGQLVAKLVGIKWDTRSIPVKHAGPDPEPARSAGFDAGPGPGGFADIVRRLESDPDLVY
jgi:hypothetical protein